VLGKCYSSNVSVMEQLTHRGISISFGSLPICPGGYNDAVSQDISQLWTSVLSSTSAQRKSRLIIIDDGGFCLSSCPSQVSTRWSTAGIEQTTSGLAKAAKCNFPVISVAASAAKRLLEPPLIAEAVARRIATLFANKRSHVRCGIIGYGSIGKALSKYLAELGQTVSIYDNTTGSITDDKHITSVEDLSQLCAASDLIFGCTGKDVFADFGKSEWSALNGKYLISCSSGDIEFRTVLRFSAADFSRNPLDTMSNYQIQLPANGGRATVIRGGFPVNFDGGIESVPAADIQLTRGLLLGAVIQILLSETNLTDDFAGEVMLDPDIQCFVINSWIKDRNISDSDLNSNERDLRKSSNYIYHNSGGKLTARLGWNTKA